MPDGPALPGKLLAISDLHVGYRENRRFVADLWPRSPHDWLLVAGDVAEKPADIEWALGTLSRRFGTVIWTPGNHELWTARRTRSSSGASSDTSTWWGSAAVWASSPRKTRIRYGVVPVARR